MRTVVKSTITPEQFHKLAHISLILRLILTWMTSVRINMVMSSAEKQTTKSFGVGIAGNGGHCVDFEVLPHNELEASDRF